MEEGIKNTESNAQQIAAPKQRSKKYLGGLPVIVIMWSLDR